MLNACDISAGLHPARAALDDSREMRERPVLPAASDFFRLRMNRHHASAGKWSDVGSSFFVESQIPSGNRLRPVTQNLRKRLAPIRPISQIVGFNETATT